MDYKDFKKYLEKQLKDTLAKEQSTHHSKSRNSRPRAKENVIAPHLKNI